ncbi:MAG: hypothetical protein NTZ46_11500 [Verrucomicrobia bacterium]|nr:hypothetical protein [Verrucomicrobiota bacterium]
MDPAFPRIPVIQIDQTGKLPEGVSDPGIKVLANEPEGGGVGLSLDFDLDSLSQPTTPLAVLQFGLERFAVKRPGQKPGVEGRGALHVMAKPSGGESLELMGSAGVSPAGIPTALYH